MLLGGGQDAARLSSPNARATVDRASCPDSSGLIPFPGIRHFTAGVRMSEPQQDDIDNPIHFAHLCVLCNFAVNLQVSREDCRVGLVHWAKCIDDEQARWLAGVPQSP